jgi:hypothetical protein
MKFTSCVSQVPHPSGSCPFTKNSDGFMAVNSLGSGTGDSVGTGLIVGVVGELGLLVGSRFGAAVGAHAASNKTSGSSAIPSFMSKN